MSVVHLLGNGPSRKYWTKRDGYKIGFNLNSEDADIVFCNDPHTAKILMKRNFNDKKTIVSKSFSPNHPLIVEKIDVPLRRIDGTSYVVGPNSGHMAYQWAVKRGFREIHVWGHDVLWTKSLKSKTDETINKDSWLTGINRYVDIAQYYIDLWGAIISVDTYIHMPKDANLLVGSDHVYEVKY